MQLNVKKDSLDTPKSFLQRKLVAQNFDIGEQQHKRDFHEKNSESDVNWLIDITNVCNVNAIIYKFSVGRDFENLKQ